MRILFLGLRNLSNCGRRRTASQLHRIWFNTHSPYYPKAHTDMTILKAVSERRCQRLKSSKPVLDSVSLLYSFTIWGCRFLINIDRFSRVLVLPQGSLCTTPQCPENTFIHTPPTTRIRKKAPT